MAKPNPSKVNEKFADLAIERAKDLASVYSQCIMLSYQTTGKLSCGFDAKDIVEWIKINRPDVFDKKGKKGKMKKFFVLITLVVLSLVLGACALAADVASIQ